ncbi:FG-GAP-like repeat-containing protein [Fulvivirga lutea]|uniref:VCBS repeat-containing protein n=1 Tax=Fulvivirga lutea TaxID=2810512 RepID=A0A974WEM3_9BACT|nr:FG-GAP-like repeat-containing protein [Fulvivirga lutea]QSE96214.1 VCBS repeat-containing protein [Fulvivirga lutea]
MKRQNQQLYSASLAKYRKFRERYLKNVQNGRFFKFSSKKKHQIISRLKRLYNRLIQLKFQLKFAAAAGSLSLIIAAGGVKAQELGPFVQNDVKNPFFRPDFNGNFLRPTFGDIDNDGDLDLLYGISSGDLYFYRNIGTPTRAKFVRDNTHPLESIDGPNGYAAPELIDIDSDGDLDLVVTDKNSAYSGGVYFHLNNDFENDGIIGNNPSFTNITGASNPINGVSGTDQDVKSNFVDIDDDGDLDVFLGQDSGPNGGYASLLFFENDGGFSSQTLPSSLPSYFETASGYQNITPTFFDVDGDGDMDLFTGSTTSQIRFFRNTDIDSSDPGDTDIGDDIAFTEVTGAANPFNSFIVPSGDGAITFMDLDDDGVDEALIGSQFGFSYFENDGAGNFTEVTDFTNPFGQVDFDYDPSPTACDIDNNGDLDIIIGNKYNSSPSELSLFRNNGDGTIDELTGTSNPLPIITDFVNRLVPEFADIDGDGDMDLFVSAYDNSGGPGFGRVLFYRNSDIDLSGDPGDVTVGDDPSFALETSPLSITENYIRFGHTIGDFDGDSDYDILLGTDNFSSNFRFFNNNGTATSPSFGTADLTLLPNPLDPGYSVAPKPEFVDIDHDGDLDVVSGSTYFSTASLSGTLELFENNGLGGLTRVSTGNPFSGIDLGNHSDPLFMDFDNDGDLDVFIGERYGRIEFLENQNIPAQISTTASTTITHNEGDSPLQLASGLSISDATNDPIRKARVVIENYISGEDLLDFDPGFGTSGAFETSGPNAGILTVNVPPTTTNSELAMVLSGVTYENIGSTVTATPRTIRFEVIDFDNTNPGSGDVVSITVNVIPTPNDPPVLSTTSGDLTYTEGDGIVAIDGGLTVSDSDNTNFTSATVSISNNFAPAEDFLEFSDQNGISGNYNNATGVLTLSGTSSVANYQTALRSVFYSNVSNNPSNLTRTISFEVNDGTDPSNIGTRNIIVVPVNDAPTLASENGLNPLGYTQNAAAIAIDPLIEVFDSDNTTIASASVTLNGFIAGDVLQFNDLSGITGSVNAGTLNLSGSATLAQYQTALRSVLFQTSNGAGSRTVNFVVNDGTDSSSPYTRTINISNAASQPPVVNTTPATTQVGSVITIDLCNIISDPDNSFEELTITVVSILSGASTTIDGCDLRVDYSGLNFSGEDIIVLRATDPDGNTDENSLTINVESAEPGGELIIYNAVSPNNDGLNDWWEIVNLTTPNEIKLFNRWGDLVKTLTNYESIPDNTQLNDIPAGTYFYKIESPQGSYEGFLVIKK